MTNRNTVPRIDEYLRERLMPVEGAIPQIPGIEMFGNSVPVGTVGGDLFEYINFQQRYDIDARMQQAQRLSMEFLTPLVPGAAVRNSVDDQVRWLKTTPDYKPEMQAKYRFARSSEQVRVAEELRDLYSTAGVLIVDAQGHGIISAKIASTVHVQPLALTPEDFLDEWVKLDWNDAAHSSSQSSELPKWHSTLNALAKDSTEIEFVQPCRESGTPDKAWLAGLWIDQKLNPTSEIDRLYIAVSEQHHAFFVDSVNTTRPSGCPGHARPLLTSWELPNW